MRKLPQLQADVAARYMAHGRHGGLALADGDPAAPEEGASTADVYLFGRIGSFLGVTAKDFVRDVAPLDVDQIVLHLNTPGGDALEGVAIANVLRAHKARVIVRVDGLAASAGSVVAAAGDEVVMGIGSQFMVHDPWTVAIGDVAELEAVVRMLDTTGNSLASTLAAKAGGTTDEWREVMRAETWYTAEEAVTAGLADRVATADETGTAEGEQITPGGGGWFWDLWDCAPDECFDLSEFTYAGRASAPEPAMPGRQTPAASAPGSPDLEDAMPFLDDVRTRLGIAADADEATTLAALDEVLAEQSEPTESSNTRSNLPEGVVTIEKATLDELRASAQRGTEARAQQEQEARERTVDAAIQDGRIAPARREAWLTRLAADPDEVETLNGLEKGLVPVEAVGRDDASDYLGGDVYERLFGKDEEKV